MTESKPSKDPSESLHSVWQKLLQDTEQDLAKWGELREKVDVDSSELADAARRCWQDMLHLLKGAIRLEGTPTREEIAFGFYLRSEILALFDDLSNGIVPNLVEDIRKEGRPLKAKEKRKIAFAIYYIERVEQGGIEDHHPIQTAAETYGVTKKTIHNWRKRRSEICSGVPGFSLENKILIRSMKTAGEAYRKTGRGAASEP